MKDDIVMRLLKQVKSGEVSLDDARAALEEVSLSEDAYNAALDHGVFNQLVCLFGNLQRHGSIFVFMFVGIATSAVLASC